MGTSFLYIFLFLLIMSNAELACTYAALILHDAEQEITSENLKSLVSAAGVEVSDIWYNVFAKAMGGADIEKICTSMGSGPAAGAAAAATAAVVEEEEEEEEEEEMGDGGLFDDDDD